MAVNCNERVTRLASETAEKIYGKPDDIKNAVQRGCASVARDIITAALTDLARQIRDDDVQIREALSEALIVLQSIMANEEIDGVGGGRIRITMDYRSPLAEHARLAIAQANEAFKSLTALRARTEEGS